MKTEILKLLRETDGYVSGQELCEHFQVSRTAVWKVINQLKEEGYQIEAVRNRGYHLLEAADVMTEAELESRMKGQWAGRNLVYYQETDSTNDRGKKLAEDGCPHGTLVVADCQNAGKGRRGRNWTSPSGEAVYMSLVLRPEILPSCASMVTLVAAMAVAEGIRQVTGLDPMIKWPNDIVVNGKKICGILTEMSAEMDCIHYVVIGIGINVNQKEFPEDIRDKATSLLLEKKESLSRSEIAAAVMESFEEFYSRYEKTGDLTLLMEDYNRMLVNTGKEVLIMAPSGNYSGTSQGIDRNGELLVQMDDGSVRRVISGEVSVRGIYGYV
ncbi:biotin--[acetyl-CoA-carboxylase] ligase [Clostridium sp. AM58-1XD]|uniref:biotin--[acetyl-CoA-carboxylase] ligase n=1 Tax=Clostridium sp. AM58-1XD TaxID=2292307 RepID=UPI000E52306F|nr:biotin--[acetyl-CoA-carboxylase] ligase [Clostridium sp. AM58-1XD]RGY99646.1 biotin--[acetyl-CoA-carboxylase] ligase [Clostridium sp. AM58-1XD]